jgi:hypothetical protein
MRALAAVMILLLLIIPPAAAEDESDDFSAPFDTGLAEKVRESNAACIRCHSKDGVNNPPRPGMDLTKLAAMTVDHGRYDASIHTGMDCRDCHRAEYQDYPHPAAHEPLKECRDCHRRDVPAIAEELAKSVHGDKLGDRFKCATCHDAHAYRMPAKIRDPKQIITQDNSMCRDCHESDALWNRVAGGRKRKDLAVAHEWLSQSMTLHWGAVRCVDCHGAREDRASHLVPPKDKSDRSCVHCHTVRSSLVQRTYRFVPGVDGVDADGFINGGLMTHAYVVGATRNLTADRIALALLAVTLSLLVLHGAIRALGTFVRRRNRHG